MRLDYKLKAAAKRMEALGVSIDIDYNFVYVDISVVGYVGVFMQGDEACNFIDRVYLIANTRCRCMDKDTIALGLAEELSDLIFSVD